MRALTERVPSGFDPVSRDGYPAVELYKFGTLPVEGNMSP